MGQITKPFMTLKEACSYTGLSIGWLRRGCKDGSVPHIVIGSGAKYLVNMPMLLEQLNRDSVEHLKEVLT